MNHDDRNGHIARYFFHCHAIISSFAKVMGLQSRLILEKTRDRKCYDTKNTVLGIEIAINMTAVIIFVIPLIIFNIGSPQFMLVANKLDFYGLPLLE